MSRGYRSMWNKLRTTYNTITPRNSVMKILREVDPLRSNERRFRNLQRRYSHANGPNKTWHVDGYDKLKPYGFPIHGGIDGFSRKIIWLKVCRTNNDPNSRQVSIYKLCSILNIAHPKFRQTVEQKTGF